MSTYNEEQDISLVDNSELMNESIEISPIETQCGVLNWEQVKRLDTLLSDTIPIHGRGNYPTLNVKLKDFIRHLKTRLIERQISLKDIRINGGVASYVLAQDNLFEFSDIDIIFTCDLLNLNTDNLDTQMSLESRFSYICDLIKETVFDCLNEYIPAVDCSASKEKLTWLNLKDAYVKKMVKIYEPANSSLIQNSTESYESSQSSSRWSLISLFNNQGQNIELKFVDKMKRQFQFSVDAFQIHLDSLLKYYDCQDSISTYSSQVDASMTENIFPSVKAESLYGEFDEAKKHLDLKLIATKRPEEIRGGGLLKYCNLIIRGFKPECETSQMNSLEKYMCSRFFIDYSDIKEQEHKLSSYLDSHFQNDTKMCINYLSKLYQVVNASTVCLMGHERKQTLSLIEQLAKRFNLQNLNENSRAEFYLDDESDSKTFSSSSSEVDSNDSQIFYRNFKPRNNNKYNNNNTKQNNHYNKKNYKNNRNNRNFYSNDYSNFYLNAYSYYPYNFFVDNNNIDENTLKQVNSSSSLTISSSISSTSTSSSPCPSPYLNDDKNFANSSSGSSSFTSSSSSSSSIVSSLVPSPSSSPPLTYNQNLDENETSDKNQKINNKSRTLYCKLPASSNTSPYIEVYENCFCPPVVPIYYDPMYINQHQQVPVTKHHFYSAPNIITRIIPSNF
ncbi:unnamed protein product [Brachionus calyciflorus]|uniref:polynucleotide adenylyltransferase n=1 Tax=Brachionus calyciflorus TaxID=104777 RepID=A0A814LHT0_9BILA|nr:unnamed protein product [Brachionus calyciflorus]